jgi:hypothetical protein
MISKAAIPLLLPLLLALPAVEAPAQDMGAEVRTWSGRSLRLSQASFEVFYTIVPPRDRAAGGAPSPGYGGGPQSGGGGMAGALGAAGGVQVTGSLRSVQQLADKGPEPIQGRRPVDYFNVYQGGVTHRLAVGSIASVAFKRQPVQNSTLPPSVAPEHFHSAATVTFTDGSTFEADYLNPGAMLLRGATPEGRVDIPWQEIETVRLTR